MSWNEQYFGVLFNQMLMIKKGVIDLFVKMTDEIPLW
jgi:hypothetical protein